jgi:hypothetical protein
LKSEHRPKNEEEEEEKEKKKATVRHMLALLECLLQLNAVLLLTAARVQL